MERFLIREDVERFAIQLADLQQLAPGAWTLRVRGTYPDRPRMVDLLEGALAPLGVFLDIDVQPGPPNLTFHFRPADLTDFGHGTPPKI